MEKIIQLKLFLTATAIVFAVLFFHRIVGISLFHIEKCQEIKFNPISYRKIQSNVYTRNR